LTKVSIPYSSGLSFRGGQRLAYPFLMHIVSIPYSSGLSFREVLK